MSMSRHWHIARAASQRLSWGVADQGVSSLTNFLLSAFIARSLGASEFGAFTLAYVTYGFALNASRGLAAEPLMIRFSTSSMPVWRRATAESTGTAFVVGTAVGIAAITAGIIMAGSTGRALLALGLALPGLLLQETWRFAFFSLGRGHYAFANDVIWALLQIPLLLLVKVTGHGDVFWFVLAWGGAAAGAALVGGLQARVVPDVFGAMRWLKSHRDLGPRYLVENTGSNSADMIRGYGVTSILGLSSVGYIQAANLLFGPFKIILYGVGITTIPEGARMLRETPRRLPTFCMAVSLVLTILACVWTLILLVSLPHGLGNLLLGDLWRPAYPLVLPTAISVVGGCVGVGAGLGLHALGASRRSMKIGVTVATLIVALALTGAWVGGVLGSLYFAAVGSCSGAILYWWELRQAFHDTAEVEVPSWMWPSRAARPASRASRSADADV
jgi:O-antigen/teichoic acid export membrane protein